MKLTNIIKTAIHNISCKKRYFITLIIFISFVMSVSLVTRIISLSIRNYYDKLVYGDMNNCCLSYTVDAKTDIKEDEVYKKLLDIPHLSEPIVSGSISPELSVDSSEVTYVSLDNVKLVCSSGTYQGFDDRSNSFVGNHKKHVSLGVKFFLSGQSTFSQTEKNVFSFYYPKEKLIKSGNEMTSDNEIMMSDYMVEHFGISDPEMLIGQKISIYIGEKPYIIDKTFTGTVNSDFYRIVPENNLLRLLDNDKYNSQILVSGSNEEFCSLKGKRLTASFYSENYKYLSDITETVKNEGLDNKIIFDENAANDYLLAYNVKGVSSYVIMLLELVIILSMGMLIINIVKNDINSRTSFFAMLRAIGMKRSDLGTMIFTEHIIILAVSALISCLLSVLFLFITNNYMKYIFGNGISVSASQFSANVLYVIPVISFIYLLILFVFFELKQKNKIRDLLM